MIYKDCEILARVYIEGSDLYTLKDDGTLDESLDIFIENEQNETVVWYEVGEMEHLSCSRGGFTHIPSIEEAKLRIDAYNKENPIDE